MKIEDYVGRLKMEVTSNTGPQFEAAVVKLTSKEQSIYSTLTVAHGSKLMGMQKSDLQVWLGEQSLRLVYGSDGSSNQQTQQEFRTHSVAVGIARGKKMILEHGTHALASIRRTWTTLANQFKARHDLHASPSHCIALDLCAMVASKYGMEDRDLELSAAIQNFEKHLERLQSMYASKGKGIDPEHAEIMATLVSLTTIFNELLHPKSTVRFHRTWTVGSNQIEDSWVIGWYLSQLDGFECGKSGVSGAVGTASEGTLTKRDSLVSSESDDPSDLRRTQAIDPSTYDHYPTPQQQQQQQQHRGAPVTLTAPETARRSAIPTLAASR